MWSVMEAELHPISHGKLERTAGAIIGGLGDRLSLFEP